MSEEMRQTFRDLDYERRLRHEYWMAINGKKLKKAGLEFDDRGDVYLFREAGKPKVNFWPSTGRWLVVGLRETQRTQSGGAEKFIAWYKKQSIQEAECNKSTISK